MIDVYGSCFGKNEKNENENNENENNENEKNENEKKENEVKKGVNPLDYADLLELVNLNTYHLSKQFNNIIDESFAPCVALIQSFQAQYQDVLEGSTDENRINKAKNALSDIIKRYKKEMNEYAQHYPSQE